MAAPPRVVCADDEVLIFGGPSGNLQATAAVLAEARQRGVPAARVICTGDIAGGGADVAGTLDLVRAAGIRVVMGDQDERAGRDEDAALDGDQRAWLAALPGRIDLDIGGMTFAVVHGAPGDTSRYIFASTPALAKKRELEAAGCDGIIAGHCGLPFTQVIDGRGWHNAGSAGMPANDGTPRVWFSILARVEGGIEIAHHALDYDVAGAAATMRRAGSPEAATASLTSGIWAITDHLPQREIHATGVPMKPGTVVWRRDAKERTKRRGAPIIVRDLWPTEPRDTRKPLAVEKFRNPVTTANGEPRASVALKSLDTLWFNTGTLCNITCRNCYIASSPKNDRLVYLTLGDVEGFLDEIERDHLPTREIGFTGGEPFMNPYFLAILEACLTRDFKVLVLTNAMRPMQRHKCALLAMKARHGQRLAFRVSLDHFKPERHEEERGVDTFAPAMDGLRWLSDNGFAIGVAGRTMWGESEGNCRQGFSELFASNGIEIDAANPAQLVLFPEMDEHLDVPEITTACWGILHKSPDDMMCATSRMVVRRKGADQPAVLACTLLAYEPQFELGATLEDASRPVALNHAHCAKFCVLGGASCSVQAAAGDVATEAVAAE
jgi:predicted phosphodiesterase